MRINSKISVNSTNSSIGFTSIIFEIATEAGVVAEAVTCSLRVIHIDDLGNSGLAVDSH